MDNATSKLERDVGDLVGDVYDLRKRCEDLERELRAANRRIADLAYRLDHVVPR